MAVRDELGNLCNRKVRLHLRSLGMPRVPEFNALRNAQRIYGQYGICIEFASGQSIPAAVDAVNQTLSLSAVDVGSCTMSQSMTIQQTALFNHGSRQFARSTDITCYWVQNVQSEGKGLAGCAAHPSGPLNSRGACVIAAAASPWTLAHEVGHVLGLRHSTKNREMMFTPTSSIAALLPSISEADLRTVMASPYCVWS